MSGQIRQVQYSDVRAKVEDGESAVLLLGNGLSKSFSNSRFDWSALRNALATGAPPALVESAFVAAETDDFEAAAALLSDSSALLKDHDPQRSAELESAARWLCRELSGAILRMHPRGVDRPTDMQAASCAAFLRPYSRIVTLNYDLLLYWVVNSRHPVERADGFGNCDPVDATALCWSADRPDRRVEYLHGALHLFAEGILTKKMRGQPEGLLQQVTDRIARRKFPLVVSAASAEAKREIIERSWYLRSVLRRLETEALPIVTFGWSASDQDAHVITAIEQSPSKLVRVGCRNIRHGAARGSLHDFALRLADAGKSVEIFDTSALDVWSGCY
jgi:hypothetical protein